MAVDSGTYDPETIARHQKIAETLIKQATAPREIRSRLQGVGQLGEGLLAGIQSGIADKEAKDSRKEAIAQALQAFGGGQQQPPAAVPMAPPTQPQQSVADNTVPIGSSQAASSVPTPDQYRPLVDSAATSNGVNPETLARLLNQESGFKPNAVSPAGAQGIAQFMPATAKQYGVNPNDPNSAIPGAAKYVSDLSKQFGGNEQFALAAYNWGPGNVQKWLASGSDPARVPPETQNYVRSITGQPLTGGAMAQATPQPPPAQNAPASPAANPGGNRGAVLAALMNPWTPPAVASALASQVNPSYGFQTLPDGTIIRTDPKSGTVQPIYQAPTKSTFSKIGQNRDGQDLYGFVNPEKGTVVPAQSPTGAQATPDASVTGDDFLKSLNDPGRADLIKGMVEGRMAPAQMGRFGTQAIQSLLKDAARYEPGFDMTKWGARAGTAKDFASGQAAKNVTSLNTVIGHLGDLSEKADALGNSSFTPYNEYIKNPLANVTGSPEVKNFNLARNAVADEMAKVFRGGGLSDAETRQWKENISAAGSPEQLKGAVKTAIGLMESRLNALNEQRNKGMSTQTEPTALLTEKSRATLDKVRAWADGQKPSEANEGGIDPAALAEAKRRGLIK